MADEVHELAVRLSPEGADETTQALDDVQEGFQDTAEETEKQSGILNDFASEFQGAGKVVLAGLGTVAAGLLARIPVIGEATSGLFAILDALILRVDEQLRPAIGDVSTTLFEFADAILQAEGDVGFLIDFVSIATVTFLGLLAAVGLAAGALFTAGAAAGVIGVALGTLIAILGIVALAAAALWVAWQQNFGNMQNLTLDFIDAVIEGRYVDALGFLLQYTENVLNFWLDLWSWSFGQVLGIVGKVLNRIVEVVQRGLNVMRTGVEALFALLIREAKSWGNRFVGIIESAVNSALSKIPSKVLDKAGLPSSVSIGRPFGDVASRGEVIQRVGQRGEQRRRAIVQQRRGRDRQIEQQVAQLVAALQTQDTEIPLSIDSRTVGKETQKWTGNAARNAGANQFVR